MPGLSWSSLRVVAADGLVGELGAALRTPILRDEHGNMLVPSSVAGETVEPQQMLGHAEVRDLLDREVWIPVRGRSAKRGHIVVLRTALFAETCRRVELADDLRWEDRHEGIDIAYVDRDVASRWRQRCAERFVRWAEHRIGEHLAFGFPWLLARAQVILEQALFVADRGTPTRRRIFVLLGVVLTERDDPSWAHLAKAARLESPGSDPTLLDQEVEAARRDLEARKHRGRKTWASGYEQRLQPPGM
jgi:hypothetical protein